MTSVVLAMNEKGLAAAADSAAVAGGKIFTADKLFQPIEGEPLCLIVYGRADVCTVPIEAVVGGYRRSRAGESFPTVKAFAEDFMSFAEGYGSGEGGGVVTGRHRSLYAADWLRSFLREYTRLSREAVSKGEAATAGDYLESCLESESGELDCSHSESILPWLEGVFRRAGTEGYVEGNIIWKNPTTRETFLHIAECQMLRGNCVGAPTNLIFAGYGESEEMPGYLEFSVSGITPDGLVAKTKAEERIGADCRSVVRAFAQDDVVNSILNGMNPAVMAMIRETFRNTLSPSIASLAKHARMREADTALDEVVEDILDASINSLSRELLDTYRRPVEEAVSLLGVDELASLSKSLVHSTTVRRHFSWDAETVGGPIDVAAVSGISGFKWVDKKRINMQIDYRRGGSKWIRSTPGQRSCIQRRTGACWRRTSRR